MVPDLETYSQSWHRCLDDPAALQGYLKILQETKVTIRALRFKHCKYIVLTLINVNQCKWNCAVFTEHFLVIGNLKVLHNQNPMILHLFIAMWPLYEVSPSHQASQPGKQVCSQ